MLASMMPFVLLAPALWFLCDDAFISYRYARHVAAGEGWRFNLGEHVPVEGISNLLWTAIAAAVEGLGGASPDVMPWVSLVLGLVGLGLLFRTARGVVGVRADTASALVVLVGTLPVWAAWSTGGLETMAHAVALLGLTAVVLGEGHAALAAVLAAAVVLLRVDGPIWVGLVAGAGAWASRGPWRAALAAAALTLGGVSTWRVLTFGEWVPNVVRIKVGLGPAVVLRGMVYDLMAMLTFPALGVATVFSRPSLADESVSGALKLLAWGGLVYVVLTGGDYLPFFRFLVPVVPLLALAAARRLDGLPRSRALPLVCGLTVLNLLPLVPFHVVPEVVLEAGQNVVGTRAERFRAEVTAWRRERDKVPFRREKAAMMRELLEPGSRVVARGVGALGYDTELFVLDQYGLVSREVAEEGSARLRAPGHDRRVQRGFFRGHVPDVLFAIGFPGRSKMEVTDAFPRQWGIFEDVGDGVIYVAELHPNPAARPGVPKDLLLVRLAREGEDPEAMRAAFKDAVRAAGYRSPPLPPLDERRRAVALEKRRGGQHLMEVLWGPRAQPRR